MEKRNVKIIINLHVLEYFLDSFMGTIFLQIVCLWGKTPFAVFLFPKK